MSATTSGTCAKGKLTGPPLSATRERVISLASASGARKAKSAAAVDGKIIPRCLSVVSELRKSASR
ncbi:MAG: hypothetical protein DME79_05810 [Verrucomicrobia bacterium]|nr:MAG: hypothetical protein DMF02_00980 [Verrucomicrobiota bacterium]PYJ33655.1 MAG: hypothetical protein DME79_05810 [Verrucomicrobiota bacterium]PYJ56973.1 MAG: hypothetical protein DME82_03610 [Verrucomicrobiota bacterium]